MELFLNHQTNEDINAAMLYKHYYGEKDSDYIESTNLKDGEEIIEDIMRAPLPNETPFGYNIGWSCFPKDINYSTIFLTTSFHLLLGK